MDRERALRAHGRAWIYLWLHLAAHVAEEASTGFLGVWNPVLEALHGQTGIPFPRLSFGFWLATLVVAVAMLAALTPAVYRGVPWLRTASVVLGVAMIVNGVHHLVSPLYLGRFLPGQYTSPLLIFAAAWLIVQARRADHSATGAPPARLAPIAGTIAFFIAAPVTVVGWIPYALSGWEMAPALFGIQAIRVAGALLLCAGIAVLIDCFARFAIRGRGTPAPIAPTETLVVSGAYRHTRNPMYVAVVAALIGQGLLLGSLVLLEYAAVVWLAAHAFVLSYEEPALRQQFPEAFEQYRTHVRRWVPRIRPWIPADAAEARSGI